MAKQMKRNFNFNISGVRATSSIKSLTFFDDSYSEPEKSPIDIFHDKKTSNIKLLGAGLFSTEKQQFFSLATSLNSEWYQLANLVILGLVSSVETYFRSIIRKLLIIDEHSKRHSYSSTVTYGAALHHQKTLLPEALLENASFTSSSNIVKSLNAFLDINLGGYSKIPSLNSAFFDYDTVCNLRHCVVHRSGHLGSNNALSLGLDEYCKFLEKPISVDFHGIQEIAVVCDTLVKEINDKLFLDTMSRTVKKFDWSGDLRKDKNLFKPYFDLFSPALTNTPSALRLCYYEFISCHDIKV
ncbi:hypothetical protein [Morganella morganii]|uniref:hypothetical protein n=1 Tax=Morganella morganii TaxID=582 RepID=UPI001162C6FA|nr:hypothetical protein [Morganella morganii]QQO72611.1 hypothetical protein IDH72_19810 [Morganella morganii]